MSGFVVHYDGDSPHESRRFASFRELDLVRQFQIFEDLYASGFPREAGMSWRTFESMLTNCLVMLGIDTNWWI